MNERLFVGAFFVPQLARVNLRVDSLPVCCTRALELSFHLNAQQRNHTRAMTNTMNGKRKTMSLLQPGLPTMQCHGTVN
jgi:hypothetical protein